MEFSEGKKGDGHALAQACITAWIDSLLGNPTVVSATTMQSRMNRSWV
jgi:hypothetical protein